MAAPSPHIPTDRPVRTRIAPSPTGDPHVGTAYMGLVNMTLARQHGGQFLLRIDDTDRTRYREGSEQAIFTALRWLGLDWDEGPDKGGPCGPYRQSERTSIYRDHCERLIASGHAYRCFCSKERLDEVRKAQQARKEQARYDRLCMSLAPEAAQARAAKGEKHVVRLKFPTEGDTVVADLLRGEVKTPNATGQDQVLLKEDGFPTYHLASCVDDALMNVTHIIRAEEWLASAPIHKVLFDALGYPVPVLCHMPLLRNNDKDKTKISKRKNPTSLLYYRDAGFLPEALLNFLGLMGWGGPKGADGQCKEHFSLAEMREAFRLEDIRLGSPVFDVVKLRNLNSIHQRALPADEYVRRARAYLFDEERFARIAGLVQHRTKTLGEFMWMGDAFFEDIEELQDKIALAIPKRVKTDEDKAAWQREGWFCLDEAMKAVESIAWTKEALESALAGLHSLRPEGSTEQAERLELKELLMLVRVAMCGKTATPPLYESMEVLGKSRVLGRLGDALRALPSPSKKDIERREKEREKAPKPGGPGVEPAA